MFTKKIILVIVTFYTSNICFSQRDSTSLENIPLKFITNSSKKIQNYSNAVSSKTDKTLSKLIKWENKIKSILERTNPKVAASLFNENHISFQQIKQRVNSGLDFANKVPAQYNQYKDEFTTKIKYIYTQKDELDVKFNNEISTAKRATDSLEKVSLKLNNVEELIKERRKELITELLHTGNLKFLKKINKEVFYYNEKITTLKASFNDVSKFDQTVLEMMNKIPACKTFLMKNSEQAGLFGMSNFSINEPLGVGVSIPIINGLSTRAGLQGFINSNVPNIQNVNLGNLLKSKITAPNNDISNFLNKKKVDNLGLPEFKVNSQKSKSFWKRIEISTDVQFKRTTSSLPNTTDIGLNIGYKLNDKSTTGLGIGYKLGMGTGLDKIKFTSEGVGLRSFIKWKLSKGFDIQGGLELEYYSHFSKIQQLSVYDNWNKLGLIGISKNYKINKKLKGSFKLFCNVFYKENPTQNQPFIFRTGYSFLRF